MASQRKIEIFSAGCAACMRTVDLVHGMACSSCEVIILEMQDPKVARRAQAMGIRSVPAVLIDGRIADCCVRSGTDEGSLRQAGIGQPLP